MPFKDTLITEECIKEITNENLQKKKKEENPITTLSTIGLKQLIQFLLPLLSYTHLCSNHTESCSLISKHT